MMVVDIQTEPSFVYGEPRQLFEEPYHFDVNNPTYDRSPVDDRFLMIKLGEVSDAITELIVVENWSEELKRSAPAEEK